VKYAAIADWATDKQYSVTFMCAQLGVVRQPPLFSVILG
jgi:hypothetical protein